LSVILSVPLPTMSAAFGDVLLVVMARLPLTLTDAGDILSFVHIDPLRVFFEAPRLSQAGAFRLGGFAHL